VTADDGRTQTPAGWWRCQPVKVVWPWITMSGVTWTGRPHASPRAARASWARGRLRQRTGVAALISYRGRQHVALPTSRPGRYTPPDTLRNFLDNL
jgi:hypothetical protein